MNQKGLSLIEVVVSLTIMTIVVAMVSRFVIVGLNTSSSTTKTGNIQREAQTTINQMKDWIMGTNKGIVCYGRSDWYDKAVAIYHKGEAEENYVQLIFYREGDACLYYDKVPVEKTTFEERDVQIHAEKIDTSGTWENYVFSKYVSEFHVVVSGASKQQVRLAIGYSNAGKTYRLETVINMRNKPESNPAKYNK